MEMMTDLARFIEWLLARIRTRSVAVRDYADLEEELNWNVLQLREDGVIQEEADILKWQITSKMRVAKRRRTEMSEGIANLSVNLLLHLHRHGSADVADFLELALLQAGLPGFVEVIRKADVTEIRSRADFESIFKFPVRIDVPAPTCDENV